MKSCVNIDISDTSITKSIVSMDFLIDVVSNNNIELNDALLQKELDLSRQAVEKCGRRSSLLVAAQ
jgi:hypothetical protein